MPPLRKNAHGPGVWAGASCGGGATGMQALADARCRTPRMPPQRKNARGTGVVGMAGSNMLRPTSNFRRRVLEMLCKTLN
jgi:hypothetical protein